MPLSPDSEFSPEEAEILDALRRGKLSRRRFLTYAAGTSAALVIAGCSTSQKPGSSTTAGLTGKPKRGGSLTYTLPDKAETLDPPFSTQFGERPVMLCIYDRLVTYDTKFNITPGLARSWSFSDGGKTLTLRLQPNVKFHDGTSCDASAVKWNLDRLMNPKVNAPMASLIVPPLSAVTVADSTTVQLHLSKPWRPLLAALADRPGYVVSPAAVRKYGKDYGSHPVGSGPFRFKSWVPGGNITLERFDGYWQKGKPYLDEIVCSNVMNPSVAVTALAANQLQVLTDIPASLVPTLAHNSSVSVNKIRGGHWYATQYDVNKPPFSNKKLMAAEGYGANRKAVLELAFSNLGTVATNPLMVGWAAPKPSYTGPYPTSSSKAKAAVAQAGSAGHQPLTFTAASDNTAYSDIAQALQPGWKSVGLDVSIQGAAFATLYADLQSGKYDWSETDWTPRADPDGLLRLLFYTGNSQNTTRFSDPQVDHLLDQAARIYDKNKALPLYEQILSIVTPYGGYDYLTAPEQVAATRSNVGGFVQYPDDLARLADLYYTD